IPDQVKQGELKIVDHDAAGELANRKGTFRRKIAQRALDFEFFTYGNPLFDAVANALTARRTGRTYAISCRAAGISSFVGLEFIVTARAKVNGPIRNPSLANLGDAIFGNRQRSYFIALLEGEQVDGEKLRELRSGLDPAGKNYRNL